MGTPNVEGTLNTDVVTGGVFGATVGQNATDAAGFHGNATVQSTGYGTPTGGSIIANFNGATATAANTSILVAQIVSELIAKGLIGK